MNERLAISEGERVLHEMLRVQGINPESPGPVGRVWDIFKSFVAVPFDTASDGVLYETGVFNFHGLDEFYLGFLRQFEVLDEDGEHQDYEQLTCEFRFPVSDETRSFGSVTRWWFTSDDEPWSAFVASVESRPEFTTLRFIAPQAASIQQEMV